VEQATGKPFSYWRTKQPPEFDSLALGVRLARDELYARIDQRVDAMFAGGFVEEVRRLRDLGYEPDLPALSSIGYGDINRHLAGETTLDEAIYRTKVATHRFARHQNAWFKTSDERIHWLDAATAGDDAVRLAEEFLA
jgi:tRNA dimethylallyltransferase